MPDAKPTVREWPPNDLIAGLSLKTIADAESELDEKVLSGMISLWSGCSMRYFQQLKLHDP